MIFYASECSAIAKQELRFLRAIVANRLTDHKRIQDITEELNNRYQYNLGNISN